MRQVPPEKGRISSSSVHPHAPTLSKFDEAEILECTKEIVIAYISRTIVKTDDLLDLIRSVYLCLVEAVSSDLVARPLELQASGQGRPHDRPKDPGGRRSRSPTVANPGNGNGPHRTPRPGDRARSDPVGMAQVPAVPIEQSVTSDYIVCLEDGRRFRTMTRWLRAAYKLTPDQYRAKWNLPSDYPMTAPSYSRMKTIQARRQGLGKTRPSQEPEPAPSAT